ncbi:Chromobox protein 3 [Orchesella cincta]|uniref:Chromobox protein 3 n=1 Tax=Orchesella cincta TaxID=48709 RepID=A0A1D2M2N8_ORCCI|nr:Chromobox protein 3 [Orchesella cincta]
MAEGADKHVSAVQAECDSDDDLFHPKDESPETVEFADLGSLVDPISASDKDNVQEIIYMRKEEGVQEFLIRWRGHHEFQSTWEKEEDLKPWQSLIDKFVSQELREEGKPKPPQDPTKRGRGRPVVANPKRKRKTEDKSVEDANTEEKIVKRLVLMRKRKNKREFLVEWEGYSPEESTWEFEEYLCCPDLIIEFLKK